MAIRCNVARGFDVYLFLLRFKRPVGNGIRPLSGMAIRNELFPVHVSRKPVNVLVVKSSRLRDSLRHAAALVSKNNDLQEFFCDTTAA